MHFKNRLARRMAAACLFALLLLSPAMIAQAKDYFLTIGGGYSPQGNQVSLEKNVLFFRGLLAERYSESASHDILFSDGDNPQRDIQYQDPSASLPRANELIAEILQSRRNWGFNYRSHAVPQAASASLANVKAWFENSAPKLKEGDRLIVYVTAHGSRASDKNAPHNTGLMLWNNERISMTEMARLLDKAPAEVPVVLVMVQCYSGGFANVLFQDGDPAKGCSQANRCGFFATVHDRVAAGCTPDIQEENYHEYSSYFWAAIRGQSRTGQAVATCDYDNNGQVSFDEAHAYALLQSPTIDISIKTSDVFLRHYSKQGAPAANAQPEVIEPPSPEPVAAAPAMILLSTEAPFNDLAAIASAVDRAVLDGLSQELGLAGPDRAVEARRLAEQLSKENKQTGGRLQQKTGELNGACQAIRHDLMTRWPEFDNPWHPRIQQILGQEGDEVTQFIESHSGYPRVVALRQEVDRLGEQKMDLDRRWVKCQRLLRAMENVVLAHNLPQVAPPEIQQRYQRLIAAEQGVLGSGPAALTAANTSGG